jgi:hypothetical protein
MAGSNNGELDILTITGKRFLTHYCIEKKKIAKTNYS